MLRKAAGTSSTFMLETERGGGRMGLYEYHRKGSENQAMIWKMLVSCVSICLFVLAIML